MPATSDEELSLFLKTVRAFVRERIVPLEKEIEERDEAPRALLDQVRRDALAIGLYGFNLPEDMGGPGLSVSAKAAICEEIGYVSVVLSEALGHLPLSLKLLNAEQRARYLDDVLAARKVFTYALTEPNAGSDLGGLETRARKVDGGWMIDGAKQFISNVETSDYILLLAVSDPDAPLKRKLTTFIVDRTNPGIKGMTRFRKMGWRGYHLNGFVLESCFVPDADVLGRPGDGFLAMMTTINLDRILSAARSVAIADRAQAMAIEWAKQRKAFGARLADHQAIQFMLADNDTEIWAARMLVRQAAALGDVDDPAFRVAASRAKLYASEMGCRVTDRVLQIFGAMGYSTELPIERFYRDARAFRIGEGTSEMQRIQIARHVLAD